MFFVDPESVTVRPKFTAVALALIVTLGLPPLGGLAATAGPTQTSASASAAQILFIRCKRVAGRQVGQEEERRPEAPLFQLVAPAGAVELPLAPPFDADVVGDVYSNSSSAPKRVSSAFLRRPSLSANASPTPTMISSSARPRRRRGFFASRRL